MRNARLRVRWLRKMWRWKTVIQTSLDQGAWKLICPCPQHFANRSPKLSTLHLNLNHQWTPDIHSCVWVWSCSARGFATQWESGVQQTSARADHIDIRFWSWCSVVGAARVTLVFSTFLYSISLNVFPTFLFLSLNFLNFIFIIVYIFYFSQKTKVKNNECAFGHSARR